VAASTLLGYFDYRHFSFRRGAADTQEETSCM
jgi:hypothetical protein